MIVVVIVAILAAIALPSYQEYIRRGRAADGRGGLMQAAQWMERASTATGLYPTALPSSLSTVDSQAYLITLTTSADATTFTLTATPQGASQLAYRCGNFTITNTGLKGAAGVTAGEIVTQCWGK
jgi:type IV pilus assembly protein PilE